MVDNKWDLRFLSLARQVASWSKDPSTKTGSVIVRPDRSVASVGFNGFPSAMKDHPGLYEDRDEKYSRIVHCEINALIFSREPVRGYTLYTHPFMSCDRCCVQMIQAGITRMVSPRATEDQLSRWAKAFERTRSYCRDAGVELVELDVPLESPEEKVVRLERYIADLEHRLRYPLTMAQERELSIKGMDEASRTWTRDQSKEFLIKAGIIDENEELTEHYRRDHSDI